ncbi:MAG: hypothetical protein H6822_32005 [Planctomycetaceae bacterium]|nr:hypothetical protein [Planctomycetaceae bacterium]MCB9924171.1 hypothetical protein [Planctomycetaceae bacterium]MCB9926808.1 hypothetical protein [Planctomycetaceae bacterium]
MSKDARNPVELTAEAKNKFEECVAAFAVCGFGADGPLKDTTFAEIEEFGHEVGRMVARAVDERLAIQHASHFRGAASCPTCGNDCPVKETPATRDLQTCDGNVPLHEPVCHCSVCHRDFFPSTHHVAD